MRPSDERKVRYGSVVTYGRSLADAPSWVLRGRGRLMVASALMLFVQLALIRWTGANLIHLSYFSNLILLASFLVT